MRFQNRKKEKKEKPESKMLQSGTLPYPTQPSKTPDLMMMMMTTMMMDALPP
jgi:hypothetical protein